MTDARHRRPRKSGRMRLLLAAGGVLLLTIGTTAAALFGESRHIMQGEGASAEQGLGYADAPILYLSDRDITAVVTAPSGRDHWLTQSGPPLITTTDRQTLSVRLEVPQGRSYALRVTPTLSSAVTSGVDAFPWLLFTVTAPDGSVHRDITADHYNALAIRTFRVCHGCGTARFTMEVSLSPSAPISVSNANANVRVTFEGMTAP